MSNALVVEYAGLSVIGHVREHNEDRLGWVVLDGGPPFTTPAEEHTIAESTAKSGVGFVFAVADGLGGYGGGDVAAGMAVDASLAQAQRALAGGGRVTGTLRDAFNRANGAILDAALGGRGGSKMQSTLSTLVITPGQAHLGHVGDSRVYRRREGELELLTTDHSQVMELLRMHIISPEQAIDHPARYALTRSVGNDITVRTDIRSESLDTEDAFLLCSDGLWSNVTSSEISEAMDRAPAEACRRLVDLALGRGGDDNATAMAIRVRAAGQRPETQQGWRRLFS
ncbi:MAG TPA: protein phosphatase 2C domain-containing protein [Candidatus Limnocylindrales bacterium]